MLSAIVFMIGVKLVDVKGMSELYRVQKDEFLIALITAGVVVFFDVMHGILAAVLLSLIDHTRYSYRLRTRVLTPHPNGHWATHNVAPNLFAAPGIVAYRFEADLFYANAGRFMEEVLRLVEQTSPQVNWVVIDASEIFNIDYTAGKTLQQLRQELDRRGVGIATVAIPEGVLTELEIYRALSGTSGHHEIFLSVDEAIMALRDMPPPTSDPVAKTARDVR